jgi:hypothetical protein
MRDEFDKALAQAFKLVKADMQCWSNIVNAQPQTNENRCI